VQRATLLAVPGEAPAPAQGMAWVGRAGLAGAGAGDAAVAARVVEELERGPSGDGGQPWAARGWFAEADRWLRSTMERLGRPLTGPVRQARVWRLSCLLRAPTGDGDVWFKANTTSPLFVNEGVVMGALAGLFPGRVPAPLAVEPERGWMVLADFGEEVGWEAPMEVVDEVAQTYARMQVEATAGLPGVDAATWLSPDEEAGLRAAVPGLQARCAELARPRRPARARPRRPAPVQRGQEAGGLSVLRLDRRLCGPPVPRPGHDPAGHGLRRRRGRGRAAGAAAAGLPPRVGLLRAARAAGPGLGAGRPAGRPAPGGQLPVPGHPAAGRPPHGPVDRLVAPPGAGRPGVTDGTGGRCRTAQPGRRPPPAAADYREIHRGKVRVSFNYFISDAAADFLVDAVDLLADHGHRLLGDYRFDPHSGRWRHRLAPPDPVPPLSELLDGRAGPDPRPGAGEDALAGHLGQARALLGAAGPFTPVAGPSWLPPELERLRDFHLPGDAAS
jgi:hypothetical protein